MYFCYNSRSCNRHGQTMTNLNNFFLSALLNTEKLISLQKADLMVDNTFLKDKFNEE